MWTRGGWPSPVTEQGQKVLGVWRGSLITAMCVGAFVIGLILWSAVFFRRKGVGYMPRQVRYNLPIEVLYTVVPVIMVAILFYFTALRENDEDKFSAHPDLRIQVVGFQWAWQFNYLNDGLSITGRPGDYPQLVIPVGEKIRFYETSPDVIHSFWVIPFLFKRDVVPGHPNSFEVTVTKQGTFDGKCTEYCGVDHDRMLFTVKAVSKSAYQAWLAKAKATAQAGTDKKLTVYNGPTTVPMGPTGNTQRSHQ
ncbi:MAG TPA: cytochrome c oxidase subunit II [Mycobacteriales bacterium]|nr:cytochrome c oxidase subunit II [Mycobacteriales bacterium]